MKHYRIINPEDLGLKSRKYVQCIFSETSNGYVCKLNNEEFIGYPKSIVENNPEKYELVVQDRIKVSSKRIEPIDETWFDHSYETGILRDKVDEIISYINKNE